MNEPQPLPPIIIEHREHHPWTFSGLRAERGAAAATFDAKTKRGHLTTGDYTLEGLEDLVAIERKSIWDLADTVLGFGDRRDRFFRELKRMAEMRAAAVIVEGTLGAVLDAVEDRSQPAEVRRRILFKSIVRYMLLCPKVQWLFLDDRFAAEVLAYRYLSSFHQLHLKERRMSNDFDFLFGGSDDAKSQTSTETPAGDAQTAVVDAPHQGVPEPVAADPEEPETPPEEPRNIITCFDGLDDGVRYNSIGVLDSWRIETVHKIRSLETELEIARQWLHQIDLLKFALKDHSAPAEVPEEPTSEPPPKRAKTAEEIAAMAMDGDGGPQNTGLKEVLGKRKIKGLGKGKLETLAAAVPTVESFMKRIEDARSEGKPDHAFMPRGIGADIVGNILEELS